MRTHTLPSLHSCRLTISGSVDGEFAAAVGKAVTYVNQTDSLHPTLYTRLELGFNWEHAAVNIISRCVPTVHD